MSQSQLPPVSTMADRGSDTSAPRSSTSDMESYFESLVRVTLAGFGGSLVGLAQQRQNSLLQQGQRPVDATSSHRRRAPPNLVRKPDPLGLPIQWAISCSMFALILETSRAVSPTTYVLKFLNAFPGSNSIHHKHELSSQNMTSQMASYIPTVGDYTIGGSIAGLSGAVAQRSRLGAKALGMMSTRRLLLWGLGAGSVLGCVAGVVQAVIDVGDLYLIREREKRATESVDQSEQ